MYTSLARLFLYTHPFVKLGKKPPMENLHLIALTTNNNKVYVIVSQILKVADDDEQCMQLYRE